MTKKPDPHKKPTPGKEFQLAPDGSGSGLDLMDTGEITLADSSRSGTALALEADPLAQDQGTDSLAVLKDLSPSPKKAPAKAPTKIPEKPAAKSAAGTAPGGNGETDFDIELGPDASLSGSGDDGFLDQLGLGDSTPGEAAPATGKAAAPKPPKTAAPPRPKVACVSLRCPDRVLIRLRNRMLNDMARLRLMRPKGGGEAFYVLTIPIEYSRDELKKIGFNAAAVEGIKRLNNEKDGESLLIIPPEVMHKALELDAAGKAPAAATKGRG